MVDNMIDFNSCSVIEPSEDVVVFQLEETTSGKVVATMPDGQRALLEIDGDDVYRRESVLAERLAEYVARRLPAKPIPQPVAPPPLCGEHWYTPRELAMVLSLDVSTIRRMFIDEAGVFKRGRCNRRDGKRDYTTLRIPASVAERVLREKSNRR
jgi:hypothetical protein